MPFYILTPHPHAGRCDPWYWGLISKIVHFLVWGEPRFGKVLNTIPRWLFWLWMTSSWCYAKYIKILPISAVLLVEDGQLQCCVSLRRVVCGGPRTAVSTRPEPTQLAWPDLETRPELCCLVEAMITCWGFLSWKPKWDILETPPPFLPGKKKSCVHFR